MLDTLLGIVSVIKEQLVNASSPMLVTLSGIITLTRDEQLANAPSPIFVTLLGIITEMREV